MGCCCWSQTNSNDKDSKVFDNSYQIHRKFTRRIMRFNAGMRIRLQFVDDEVKLMKYFIQQVTRYGWREAKKQDYICMLFVVAIDSMNNEDDDDDDDTEISEFVDNINLIIRSWELESNHMISQYKKRNEQIE
eukprot:203681_1